MVSVSRRQFLTGCAAASAAPLIPLSLTEAAPSLSATEIVNRALLNLAHPILPARTLTDLHIYGNCAFKARDLSGYVQDCYAKFASVKYTDLFDHSESLECLK